MKLEKNLLMVITFVASLLVLLLVFYILTRFASGLKDMIGAIYFALWITALMGLWLYIIQPYLKDRKKKKPVKGAAREIQKPVTVPSPRSNLPLRDRIREYVAERRKEEGLPVPEPLRPSRSTGSAGASASRSGSSGGYGVSAGTVAAAASTATVASMPGADEGDLPLPDDFDEAGGGDLFGEDFSDNGADDTSLPGIGDDDFGSYDDTGVDEKPVTESGDLPDFEGDLDDDMSESDFSDSLTDDFSSAEEPVPEPPMDDDGGGLSDEGLSDFDMPIDEGLMDDDLSGDNELSDIEFEDLEPDEV